MENYKLRVSYCYNTSIYDLSPTGEVIVKNKDQEETKVPFYSVIRNDDQFFIKADIMTRIEKDGNKVWKIIKTFK
jgi:hypothetical protein